MKKLLLTLLLATSISIVFAQSKGDFRVQLGGDFGFDTELFGLNLGGEYFFTDQISAAPNFTFYFPDYGSLNTLNVDARYYFTQEILQWYGMLGFTNNWVTIEATGDDFTSSNAGANIGAGGVLKFADQLAFNPELKYQIQDGGQAVFRLALVYFFN
ncbi:hypothetical protein QWY93_05380 [Echinicola jeungdonensis]|uniref:Outer membrane beta-barrel protein n=1 Tax=Echinicola jeungdonensis TaxID=709343 RepID=A0ABV5J4J9_9BACT|nr:outer membrane beta-barrel protein [Echinicola jeungdonensis]MDN3668755.1 hypothetical protein [Echinicola jeungdonensis]